MIFSKEWANGDGCCDFPHTPPIILYSDGTIILTKYVLIDERYRSQILFKKLSRQEICRNLNTLDQIGFLAYNPSTYVFNEEPALEGGGRTAITVNAWKSIRGSFDSLDAYISLKTQGFGEDQGIPVILPALYNASLLFENYPEDGFVEYKPEEFGIWIMPAHSLQNSLLVRGNSLEDWPLEDMPLNSIVPESNSTSGDNLEIQFVKISGDHGKALYDFVGRTFADGDTVYEIQEDVSRKYYYIFVRPLLPYEQPSATYSDFSASGIAKLSTRMNCYPSDGVLPIPTPSNP